MFGTFWENCFTWIGGGDIWNTSCLSVKDQRYSIFASQGFLIGAE